jgi:hypothetical protein
MIPIPKRLDEFFRRLLAAPAASKGTEVRKQLEDVLTQVEDELSGIPFDPNFREQKKPDGRMYPPQDDRGRPEPGHADVRRYRTTGHQVFIRENGAILIREVASRTVVLNKPGKDGKEVFDKPPA